MGAPCHYPHLFATCTRATDPCHPPKPRRGDLFVDNRDPRPFSFCFSAPKAFGAEKQKECTWGPSGYSYKQATLRGLNRHRSAWTRRIITAPLMKPTPLPPKGA